MMKIYVTALVAVTGLVATTAFFLTPDSKVATNSTTIPAAMSATNQATTQAQGMVAIVDSESGTLRAPTAAEAQKYAPASRAPAAEAKVLRRADGSESMMLDDSYTIYSVVTRGSDGQWNKICTTDHDHALHQTTVTDVRAVK